MGKTLDDLQAERPGDPEAQAAHQKRMLAEVRTYKLRELRELRALTQTDVAQTLSISQKRVSEIERGQATSPRSTPCAATPTPSAGRSGSRSKVGDDIHLIA